ncbi:MAG: hypothetical protein Q9201_004124 [Fulgogasparrea decipioides]
MAYDPNYYSQQSYAPYPPQQQQSTGYTPHVCSYHSSLPLVAFSHIPEQGDRQLTQSRNSPQPAYPTTQSLTPYHPPSPGYNGRSSSRDERYLYADEDRERRHRHRSRSRSHSHRSKSRSRSRDLGATLIGAAGGGFLGSRYGGGALGTIGGAVAGAVGANLAEKEWDKHKDRRDHRREFGDDREGRGGVVDTLLHPERAISRARSKVRDAYDDFEDGGRRKHRHRHRDERGARSLSRGYYEEEYEQKRRFRD